MTLAAILQLRAVTQGEKKVFSFLQNGEEETACFTFLELDRRARAIAMVLQDAGCCPGDRVLMMYSPGISFIEAFYGCLYAGMIAVPVKPPAKRQTLQAIEKVALDCEPALAITDWIAGNEMFPRLTESNILLKLRWLTTDKLAKNQIDEKAKCWQEDRIKKDAIAFLQYTSGSTGSPKGVCVNHSNIIANMKMINEAFGHNADTTMVGWLPLFHDMGLVGNIMQPVFNGFLSVLMPPVAFLQKPMRWLKTISNFSATSSGGPNFAYELCNTKFRPEQLSGVNLSTWQVAYNGAEPIRAATLRKFTAQFAVFGFNPAAFHPCYGMAETTLIAAGGWIDESPKIIALDTAALENGKALEKHSLVDRHASEGVTELVRSGKTICQQEIRIVDTVSETLCADGQIGEIWIRGDNVANGYWNKPAENADVFGGQVESLPGKKFLKTGDLGFMRDGELYVCGRCKDVIIINGRNLFPQDVEQCAEDSYEGFVTNGSVAFSVEVGESSKLVLVMEVKRVVRQSAVYLDFLSAARNALSIAFGIIPHDMVLIDEMSLPRTSSGKLRRNYCRLQYQEGKFESSIQPAATQTKKLIQL